MTGHRYEWNEAKRKANLAKHGVDFADITRFDWSRADVMPDARKDYAEPRFIGYGRLAGQLWVVVFTDRGPIRRIISLRRANRREQAAYHSRNRR